MDVENENNEIERESAAQIPGHVLSTINFFFSSPPLSLTLSIYLPPSLPLSTRISPSKYICLYIFAVKFRSITQHLLTYELSVYLRIYLSITIYLYVSH